MICNTRVDNRFSPTSVNKLGAEPSELDDWPTRHRVLLFFCPEGAIDPLPEKLTQEREVDVADRQSGMLSHAPGWVLQGVQFLTGFGHCVRRRKCALVAYTS